MKRTIIIASGIVIIGLIVATVLVMLQRNQSTTNTTTTDAGTNTNPADSGVPAQDQTAAVTDREAAQAVAVLVAERVGSYSSETLDRVPESVASFLTDAGTVSVDTLVRQERARLAGGPVAGYSTRALTTSFTSYRFESSASVTVGTRRIEEVVGNEPKTLTGSVALTLVRTNGVWKATNVTVK